MTDVWESSRVVGFALRVHRALGRSIETSRIVDLYRRIGTVIGNASETAISARIGRSIASVARKSFLYRWLTAEPEPDVIVIDLQETRTVGPILQVLDWASSHVTRFFVGSRLRVIGSAVQERVTEAPVRILGIVALVAILTNTLLGFIQGSLGPTGLGVRLLALAGALIATRIDHSANQLRKSRVGRFGAALLTPPESPDRED